MPRRGIHGSGLGSEWHGSPDHCHTQTRGRKQRIHSPDHFFHPQGINSQHEPASLKQSDEGSDQRLRKKLKQKQTAFSMLEG